MSDEIRVEYGYRMEGHYVIGNVDTEFYRHLPSVDERYINPQTGRPEIPHPDLVQILSVVGAALLSSTVLATAIKAYLQTRRTKVRIVVENEKVSIEYEGPNLKDSEEAIKSAIDLLVEKADRHPLRLTATRIVQRD
ncbi:MAG: hypothetical protein WC600_07110 [Desulfobaccales bacterium]